MKDKSKGKVREVASSRRLYDGISGTVTRKDIYMPTKRRLAQQKVRCDLALEIEALEHSNYIEGEYSDAALEYAFVAWVETLLIGMDSFFTIKIILDIHELLLLTLNTRIAGRLRTCDVTVGGRFIPFISEALLKEEMEEWIAKHGKADTEESIKEAHIAFEKIHPFEDGNGRVGRILMMWQRKKAGLPVKIIHEGKEQQEYYGWFK